MKLKYPIKNPVTVTNFCLMLLPLLFILLEILKINSEDIKFDMDLFFILGLCLLPFIIIAEFLFNFMTEFLNINEDTLSKPVTFILELIFDYKYTGFIVFIFLFILSIISFILYRKNKINAYRKLAFPLSALWLFAILIVYFIFLALLFTFIKYTMLSKITAFLITSACFLIFLPLYIIAVITVDKTFSTISSGQPHEKENEKTL